MATDTTWLLSWLAGLEPSSHSSIQKTRKRKRAGSEPSPTVMHLPSPIHSPTSTPTPGVAMSTERNQSPSKRARPDDEVLPEQSISMVAHPLALEMRSTFSAPTSQGSKTQRSSSPSRETEANLRFANPPIRTEPFNGVRDPIPQRVRDMMDKLEPDNVERWVPVSLKESIMSDEELGEQRISKLAWNPDDNDWTIGQDTLKAVKDIFLCARHCTENGRDENAWCAEVVRPLLILALGRSHTENLMVQSVQSQTINPAYLSAPASSSKILPKPRLVRKADFTLTYSDKTPTFEALYKGLRDRNCAEVSHMTDAYTKKTPVFTAVKVKPSDGSKPEAQYQLSIWLAASLRKKAELARAAGLTDTTNLVEPAFVIVGHHWYFYLGYLPPNANGAAHILEQGSCNTDSISGIFKLLRVLTGVVEYGIGGTEGREGDGLWGGFLGPVLETLAGLRRKDEGRGRGIRVVSGVG